MSTPETDTCAIAWLNAASASPNRPPRKRISARWLVRKPTNSASSRQAAQCTAPSRTTSAGSSPRISTADLARVARRRDTVRQRSDWQAAESWTASALSSASPCFARRSPRAECPSTLARTARRCRSFARTSGRSAAWSATRLADDMLHGGCSVLARMVEVPLETPSEERRRGERGPGPERETRGEVIDVERLALGRIGTLGHARRGLGGAVERRRQGAEDLRSGPVDLHPGTAVAEQGDRAVGVARSDADEVVQARSE